MAGTAVMTKSMIGSAARGEEVRRYTINWTSDAAGAVNGTNLELTHGTIVGITFVPGAGADQPTDLYDVSLRCVQHNVTDVFQGEGANLSNVTSTHHVAFALQSGGTSFVRQWLHGGEYEFVVGGAGNANTGLAELFITPRPI